MRKFGIMLLLFFALIATAAGAPAETDSVLAAVNGDPITLGEILPSVREKEFQLRSAYSGKELENEILKLRHQTVEEIIDRKLIVADFHAQQLNIPPQELENELDRWGTYIGCHSRKDLEERLRNSGSSMKKMRKRLLDRMIVQVMRRREYLLAGPPTPSDLYKRFKEEEKNLSSPGSVELALLRLTEKELANAPKVNEALQKDPGSWSRFAASYAIIPGSNGSIGSIDLDKLRPEFAKVLTEFKEQKIYPPVETPDGIYFIKVLKYQAPRKAFFKDHIGEIRKKMEDEIYKKSSVDYARRLRDGAVIEYFFPVPEGVKKK